MSLIDAVRERVLAAYGPAIGNVVGDLTTPALILDLPTVTANIGRMADALDGGPVSIRPHMKAHKSPDIARLQAAAGATGFSTATVWEAIVLAIAGFDDLFIVNTVADSTKIRRLAELARDRRVLIAVDDPGNVDKLAGAAAEAGAVLGVVIEMDTGMDRAGIDDPREVVPLAQRIMERSHLRLEGVTGYEGHCSRENDVQIRARLQRAAMNTLMEAAGLIRAAGFPCPIVSAGGTRTWWMTASTTGVTEIQAGSYAVMDRFHAGIEGGFEQALRIATTVISRPSDRLILDAGSKSVADPAMAVIQGHEDLPVVTFDEEHGIYARSGGGPALGEVVELLPGYGPSTVDMYDAYHVVQDGRVVDIWPIVPRGPGHHGLDGLDGSRVGSLRSKSVAERKRALR